MKCVQILSQTLVVAAQTFKKLDLDRKNRLAVFFSCSIQNIRWATQKKNELNKDRLDFSYEFSARFNTRSCHSIHVCHKNAQA